MPEQELLISSEEDNHRLRVLPSDVRERADDSLLFPVPGTGSRQSADRVRPPRFIREDAEPCHTPGQQKRKPLAKKHIVKMSVPLPSVTLPVVDDDETLKASAIKAPLPASQDDDETLKEAMAAQPTHIMPVSPRLNVATRKAISVHSIDALPATSEIREMYALAQKSALPVGRQRVLPALSIPSMLVRSWQFSRLLLILIVLAPLVIGGGVLEAIQLNQRQQSLYQVNARTGAIQWQQTLSAEGHSVLVDAEGSLLNVTTDQGLHQIVALNRNNVTLWKSAQSQNTFSLFPDSSHARTVLLALSGNISAGNAVNGNTATYLHPLVFSLLDRQSGKTLWQKTLVSPQQQQGAALLGMDTHYMYVALIQTAFASSTTTQGTQLLALNRSTGQVAWRITDHTHAKDIPQDAGQLLLQPHLLVWQVAGTLYAIDATEAAGEVPGKVLWHKSIAETIKPLLPQEEGQMIIAGKYLLIERSDAFHALDLHNGNALWGIANPGIDPSQSPSDLVPTSITSYNNIVLLYGNGAIEALDTNTQQIIWSQLQLDGIPNLQISDDGTLAYAITTDSIEGSPIAQALVAIDMKNGSVRWTFQPSAQVSFIPFQSSGILNNRGIVLTSFCLTLPPSPCTQQFFYALNAATGAVIWKYVGTSISDVQLSDDGTTVLFQRASSAWFDLTERFKNA